MKVSQEHSLSDQDHASQARTGPTPTSRPPLRHRCWMETTFQFNSGAKLQGHSYAALPSMAVITNELSSEQVQMLLNLLQCSNPPPKKKTLGGKYKMHLICQTPSSQQCQLAMITNWGLQFTQENQIRANILKEISRSKP